MSARRVRQIAVAMAVALLVGLLSPATAQAATEPAHGVVGTTCDSQRVTSNRAAGITMAVLGARWDLLVPARGSIDRSYRALLAERLQNCVRAGIRVIVDAGVQYVPAWARQLPGASLRDQRGDAPVTGQIDVVFSAAVRDAVAEYLRELVAALPPYTVEAIRVGTSIAGELGYPGPTDGGRGYRDSWWGFGPAPQSGTGLAPGQARSPLPGWVPGTATWNGRSVTPYDTLNWFRWYDRAVAQAVWFQARVLADAGFRGSIHLPLAGRGVLPAGLEAALYARLDVTHTADDSFARGLDYVDQLPELAKVIPGLVIDLTSVDDASAPAARAVGQDACALGDAEASVDRRVRVDQWSRLRFARAQVARAGLPAVGENPGPPGPQTGGVPESESEADQLRRSPGYARGCALAALLFAFEDDLYSGRTGVSLKDYASAW